MKLTGKFIGFLIMTISFSSFSGSRPSSWKPDIDSSACVDINEKQTSSNWYDNPVWFTWKANPECEKAINSGYASGVRIMGSVSYVPDSTTSQFNKVLRPNMNLTLGDLGIYGSVNGHPARLVSMPSIRWGS
ncbi:hypothetical protein [Escherichia coli]|uniref:hypothetical protein n=1 Tax=Escherichia coli TaxID=562 RepID=UPI001058EE58|nr:hypothetical protein [Escherichia coli]HAH2772708.1 hypothetical protein [Escherichia coli]HAM4608379.1 hypothetical protein [Escherichia coli]